MVYGTNPAQPPPDHDCIDLSSAAELTKAEVEALFPDIPLIDLSICLPDTRYYVNDRGTLWVLYPQFAVYAWWQGRWMIATSGSGLSHIGKIPDLWRVKAQENT